MTFDEHVAQRMAKGQAEYGDASWEQPIEKDIEEGMEEFADVGGWVGEIGLSKPMPDSVRNLCVKAVEHAREGYQLLKTAKILLGLRGNKQVHARFEGPAGGSIELGHVEGRKPRALTWASTDPVCPYCAAVNPDFEIPAMGEEDLARLMLERPQVIFPCIEPEEPE